jgi:hypothetical protein
MGLAALAEVADRLHSNNRTENLAAPLTNSAYLIPNSERIAVQAAMALPDAERAKVGKG